MVNWGLGIEHEMRVRFHNKLTFLNIKNKYIIKIIENFKYIPDYLFIDSSLLLTLYRKYSEIIIEDYYKKQFNLLKNIEKKNTYIKKNEDHIINYILNNIEEHPYQYLHYCVVNNIDYPINQNKFFNLSSKKWFDFFYYYVKIYSKKFFFLPIHVFFIYKNNNYIRFSLESVLPIDNIDLNNKKNIQLIIKNLKNGTYEKELKKLIEVELKKYKYINYIIVKSEEYIDIEIKYHNNNNSYISINKLEKYINEQNSQPSNIQIQAFLQNISKKFHSNKNNDENYYKIISLLQNLYQLEIPEIDYTSQVYALEFKTYDYKNNNYKKQLDDLISIETLFFNIINEIPELQPLIEVFGNIEYHNTGSLENTIMINNIKENNINFQKIEKDYSGSFHVWITIPYDEKCSPENFLYQHECLGNRLQLLEPIFSSYFTSPDINSIGNKLTHSRTSLRQFLNTYAGYGTSNVSYLNGIEKEYINSYYLSKDDVFKNNYITLKNYKKVYDSQDNKILKNYDMLTTRSSTVSFYYDYFEKSIYENNNYNKNNKNIHFENYLIKLFKTTNITPEEHKIPLGADIRTSSMNKLFYPELLPEYKEVYILENNKFIKYYIDIPNQKITNKPKFDMKSYHKLLKNERIGIEFRIFDHQPTSNLIQFLAICAQIVTFSMDNYKKLNVKDLYIYNQLWHDEMYKSMINGFEYQLSKPYMKLIEKEFNIKFINEINDKNSIKNELNGKIFFEQFYKNMNKKLNKNKIYHKLGVKKEDVIFENFNEKVWTYNFYLFLEKNPKLLKSILDIIYSNKNNNNKKKEISTILGENFSYNINKIMTILN